MEDIKIGDRRFTHIAGERRQVVIVDIREPMTVVNWTSADQGKRVYKVKVDQGLARISRKYHVRQAHQLSDVADPE
jgi:hypothetical protein